MSLSNLKPSTVNGEKVRVPRNITKLLGNTLKRNNEELNQSMSTMTLHKPVEFTTDDASKVGTGAIKYDGGKPCTYRGVVQYFPRAVNAVAEISTFGAKKYAWAGWEGVDDGIARYSDAMVRHLFKEGAGEIIDPDSGLLHAAHTAWGALARLELILREREANAKG